MCSAIAKIIQRREEIIKRAKFSRLYIYIYIQIEKRNVFSCFAYCAWQYSVDFCRYTEQSCISIRVYNISDITHNVTFTSFQERHQTRT